MVYVLSLLSGTKSGEVARSIERGSAFSVRNTGSLGTQQDSKRVCGEGVGTEGSLTSVGKKEA